MKACTRCEEEYEATVENFPPDKRNKSGLQGRCRICQRELNNEHRLSDTGRAYHENYRVTHEVEIKAQNKMYREDHKVERKAKNKVYRLTVSGYLYKLYGHMTERCSKQKSYLVKGIKNKFLCAESLIDYVTYVMRIDPVGLQCHRKDNDGHYEPGNIIFLTTEEHGKIHAEARRKQ
jgi:hypothetical protein